MNQNTTPRVQYTLCPYCGKKIQAGVKFCTGCGASLSKEEAKTEHICKQCGQTLKSTEKFCPNCGAAYVPVPEQTPAGTKKEHICPKCGEILSTATKFCPKCGNPCPVRPEQASEGTLTHEQFFQRNATSATKFWRSALPIIGFISCAVYLIVALFCLTGGIYRLSGVLYLFDFMIVCGLSVAMLMTKKTMFYIILTVYMGVSLIIAAFEGDFSNLFYLCVGIYTSVKLYKIDNQYKSYLNPGTSAYY